MEELVVILGQAHVLEGLAAVLGLVHELEGFVAVLGLVYVLEEQGQEGLVGLEELGLVPGLEVLLLLALVEAKGLAVEGQLLWFLKVYVP